MRLNWLKLKKNITFWNVKNEKLLSLQPAKFIASVHTQEEIEALRAKNMAEFQAIKEGVAASLAKDAAAPQEAPYNASQPEFKMSREAMLDIVDQTLHNIKGN